MAGEKTPIYCSRRQALNSIKVGIIDNDYIQLDNLCSMLEQWAINEISYSKSIMVSGKDYLKQREVLSSYDIFFIDIHLPDADGLEIAADMRKRGFNGMIVFVTKNELLWQKSFDVKAFNYYVKPIKIDDVVKCMNSAVENKLGAMLYIKISGDRYNIPLDSITYISVSNHHITIHTDDGDITKKVPMKEISNQLPPYFIKCHKSYIANMKRVRKISGYEIIFNKSTTVYMSRKFSNTVINAFVNINRIV